MTLTKEQIKAISPLTPDERIETFLPLLNTYLPAYDIDTPVEVASYLAQVLHESGGLKYTRELWGPTPSQIRYERDFKQPWTRNNPRNKLSFQLGNEYKGDGKKFLGRGLVQTTGRYNYYEVSLSMFNDDRLLNNPELLQAPVYAVWSSVLYWQKKKLDKLDDDMEILRETKVVNGGYNGLTHRQLYFDKAVQVFGIEQP